MDSAPVCTDVDSVKDMEHRPYLHGVEKDGEEKNFAVDAFGDETNAEIKYKVLTWWQCGLLMIAENVSLGVLSLPAAVAALGLAPAIILIIGLGVIATYTGYVLGQFKWRFPQVCNMADAGQVLMGQAGREILGIGQLLFFIFIMGSHLLTFSVALNTLTNHGTCSIVFGVVGLVIAFACSLPRTLANISWFSMISFASIISAVFITIIGVGIERPNTGVVEAAVDTSLESAFSAVLNIIFSYAGHVAFFSFMAELRDPRDYPKALCMMQAVEMVLYIVAGVVLYYYAGADVASPALGSASPVVAKVAYGIALPAILISGVVCGHVAAKGIYTRVFSGTDRVHKRDLVAIGSWTGIVAGVWIIAWVIAEAIPVFSSLLNLISSLFASWYSFGLAGFCWLYMNKGLYTKSWSKILLTIINVALLGIAACICGLGLFRATSATAIGYATTIC
ncbi:hypothetical protein MW887_010793 [Aspergillus wentii]|nr:hypothetical protein MW887_010793 [Aspergillus wentii]